MRWAFPLMIAVIFVAARSLAQAPSTAQKDREDALDRQLRCVVCQSESINDSQADMARDMRLLVSEKIQADWSDKDIKDYLVRRYGDFILLDPPVKERTYALWGAPIFFLFVALWLSRPLFRRRKETL